MSDYDDGSGHGIIEEVTPSGNAFKFATLPNPAVCLAFDADGNLYVTSGAFSLPGGGGGGVVEEVTPSGGISTFATGFIGPVGLAFGSGGNLFVGDYLNNTIDEVTPGGGLSIFATDFDNPSYGLAFWPAPAPEPLTLLGVGIGFAVVSRRSKTKRGGSR